MSGSEPTPGTPFNPDEEPESRSDAGVLGRLPRSRPGTRSPRRSAAPKPAGRAEARPSVESEPAEGASAADLEALARAGLTAAGSAASLGVRIATRAATALRDAVERR